MSDSRSSPSIEVTFEPGSMGGRFRVASEKGFGAKLSLLRNIDGKNMTPLMSAKVKIGMHILKINNIDNVHKMKFKNILILLRSIGNKKRTVVFGYPPEEEQEQEEPKKEIPQKEPKKEILQKEPKKEILQKEPKNEIPQKEPKKERIEEERKETLTITSSTQKPSMETPILSLSPSSKEHVHSFIKYELESSRSWICNACKMLNAPIRYQCEGGYCMWNVCGTCESKLGTAKSVEENTLPCIEVTTKPLTIEPPQSDDLDEFENFLNSTCRSAASLESEIDNHLTQSDLQRASEIDAHLDELMEDL